MPLGSIGPRLGIPVEEEPVFVEMKIYQSPSLHHLSFLQRHRNHANN